MVKKNILGVGITDASEKDILEYCIAKLTVKNEKLSIYTPNPEIIVYSYYHKEFKKVLNDASISLCDGIGLYHAALILGKPLKQRITGVDFVKKLAQQCEKNGFTVGFLGGRPSVALKASDRLKKQFPNLKVVLAMAGNPDMETVSLLKQTNNIDVLFVGFGFPKQEEFIASYLSEIPVTLAMGVGGTFDYLSGNVKRAPYLIRLFGFEWLFRLLLQPWRIKRQFALLVFIYIVIRKSFARL